MEALPSNAALIDYTLFTPYDFETRLWAEAPHVGAVVLRPDADAVFVDLGPLAVIQSAIEDLSATLGSGDRGKIAGVKLHRALMAPLDAHIGEPATLFISQAGPLGLIPYDMLRTSPSDISTLAASGPAIRLLATGRALVAEAPEAAGRGRAAFGAVDYEQAGSISPTSEDTDDTLLALIERARASSADSVIRAGGLQNFASLVHTAAELNAIARIWRKAGGDTP